MAMLNRKVTSHPPSSESGTSAHTRPSAASVLLPTTNRAIAATGTATTARSGSAERFWRA